MDLKRISESSVPRALELGERYRLLNEPDQAASICRDVLEVDQTNQQAARMLLLALTDQFSLRQVSYRDAEKVLDRLESDYDRCYYRGIIYERWGRAELERAVPLHIAGEWLQRAMTLYEEAETMRPPGDDSALLRYNTCARMFIADPRMGAVGFSGELHAGD
jgi:hypothetical protein